MNDSVSQCSENLSREVDAPCEGGESRRSQQPLNFNRPSLARHRGVQIHNFYQNVLWAKRHGLVSDLHLPLEGQRD